MMNRAGFMGMGISHPRCLRVSFWENEAFNVYNDVGYQTSILALFPRKSFVSFGQASIDQARVLI
jgi:hypothetical protein